ncbi:MEDS domain-containing protein [Mycobacterium simiae]|nr:MEDS domain-containing protein [Mycobacterium simiae]
MTSDRQHDTVNSAAGLIPFGHLGWGYRRRGDFELRAVEYLTDGLRAHQYVMYVGAGTSKSLARQVDTLRSRLPSDVSKGRIHAVPIQHFYAFLPGTDIVDPETSVAAGIAATQRAIAGGFSGLRAVVDGTAVARTPDQRESFSACEFLMDQQMAKLPVSALCAYDVQELGLGATGLVCLHPYVNAGAAPFQIYSAGGTDIAVCGEIDACSDGILMEALRTIWRRGSRTHVGIDASALAFLAVGSLHRLNDAARRDGIMVTLQMSSPLPIRLPGRSSLSNVLVEVAQRDCPAPVAADDLQRQLADLRNKLASQPVIEQAKGMLMQAFGLTAEHAFQIIKALSQDGNIKLREAARQLVDTWASQGPRPGYDAASEFLLRLRHQLRHDEMR